MKAEQTARHIFGVLAFIVATMVIYLVLSPYVSPDKEQVANVILGNVLGWPMIVLSYYYGSSQGSQQKTDIIADQAEHINAIDPRQIGDL